jgi:acyl carrier protein phosphodiesterase
MARKPQELQLRSLKQSRLDTPEQMVARQDVFWAGFGRQVSPDVVMKGIPKFLDWALDIRKNIWQLTTRLVPEDQRLCEQRWIKCEVQIETLREAQRALGQGQTPPISACLLSMAYLHGEMRGLYASLQETFPEFAPKKEKS